VMGQYSQLAGVLSSVDDILAVEREARAKADARIEQIAR